jgi:hypothetical protein
MSIALGLVTLSKRNQTRHSTWCGVRSATHTNEQEGTIIAPSLSKKDLRPMYRLTEKKAFQRSVKGRHMSRKLERDTCRRLKHTSHLHANHQYINEQLPKDEFWAGVNASSN